MARKMIDIPTRDGVCDSYVSFPDTAGRLPAVLFYMDAIGLRPRIKTMADTLAAQGYYVIAPNLFYRTRRAPVTDYTRLTKPGGLDELFPEVMAMARTLNPELSQSDATAFIEFLKAQDEVDGHRIGVTGYCMGGGQALRTAGNFPAAIKAAASYHAGNLATDSETSPHHWFPRIRAEVYIGHADKDRNMPLDQITRVEEELGKAKVKSSIDLYQGCLHGWTMSDLPVYNKEGEEKHWQTLFDLFGRTLRS